MELIANFDAEQLQKEITKDRLFDARWYERRYGLKFASVSEALEHYMLIGIKQRYNPNALFDTEWYTSKYLSNDFRTPAFIHYLILGADLSHWPHPLVDITYVSEQLTETKTADFPLSALLHKCTALKLSPHPTISTSHYLTKYPELALRRVHPIIHYFERGLNESRSPHPLISPDYLKEQIEDQTKRSRWHLNYIYDPALFSISPSVFFDSNFYLDVHPDLKDSGINPLYHYLRFGYKEGRAPNSLLDPHWVSQEYKAQLKFYKQDPLSFVATRTDGFVYANPQKVPLRPLRIQNAVKPRRKKILYISHNLRMQGAQTSLFELVVGMKSRYGHHVEVMAPDDGPMKERYVGEAVNVRKFILPSKGFVVGVDYHSLLANFERQILDFAPDIVHANTIQTYAAIALATRHKIPTVWNIRESEDPGEHGLDYATHAHSMLQEAVNSDVHFAFVSATTARLWADKFPNLRYSVTNNGIDYNRLCLPYRSRSRSLARASWDIHEDDIVMLSVGTWTERKGQRDIVNALEKIDKRYWSRLKVLMLGSNESPYAQDVLRAIQNIPVALRSRVTVVPETAGLASRARVLQAFAAADLFVFTSRIESYPRVVNEAMFFGLPIVATPCFGVIEQLEDGVSARFYEAGDIAKLAELVQYWISDATSRRLFGERAALAATDKVMQYDGMLSAYNKLYDHI